MPDTEGQAGACTSDSVNLPAVIVTVTPIGVIPGLENAPTASTTQWGRDVTGASLVTMVIRREALLVSHVLVLLRHHLINSLGHVDWTTTGRSRALDVHRDTLDADARAVRQDIEVIPAHRVTTADRMTQL